MALFTGRQLGGNRHNIATLLVVFCGSVGGAPLVPVEILGEDHIDQYPRHTGDSCDRRRVHAVAQHRSHGQHAQTHIRTRP